MNLPKTLSGLLIAASLLWPGLAVCAGEPRPTYRPRVPVATYRPRPAPSPRFRPSAAVSAAPRRTLAPLRTATGPPARPPLVRRPSFDDPWRLPSAARLIPATGSPAAIGSAYLPPARVEPALLHRASIERGRPDVPLPVSPAAAAFPAR